MSATPAATPSARPSQNPIPLLRLLALVAYHRRPLRLPLRSPTRIWGQARKAKQPGGVGGRGGATRATPTPARDGERAERSKWAALQLLLPWEEETKSLKDEEKKG
jgi:hypothetical protein